MKAKIIYALLAATLLSAAFAFAQVPQLLNYQGKLSDKDGKPTSGTYVMIFKIYTAKEGGAAIWDETQTVTVSNGIFNVLLGSVKSISKVFFTSNTSLYLGITVNESEMTPRFQLSSIPYALHAQSADSVKDAAITYRKQTVTTFTELDSRYKSHTGTGRTVISDFSFSSVPAGDVCVILTCTAALNIGSNISGSLDLEIGAGNSVDTVPTHLLNSDKGNQLTFHGCLKNFSGGNLTVRLIASGEEATTSFFLGAKNGDGRFGRKVTVIAGL